jgi:hypothetical protein
MQAPNLDYELRTAKVPQNAARRFSASPLQRDRTGHRMPELRARSA